MLAHQSSRVNICKNEKIALLKSIQYFLLKLLNSMTKNTEKIKISDKIITNGPPKSGVIYILPTIIPLTLGSVKIYRTTNIAPSLIQP